MWTKLIIVSTPPAAAHKTAGNIISHTLNMLSENLARTSGVNENILFSKNIITAYIPKNSNAIETSTITAVEYS